MQRPPRCAALGSVCFVCLGRQETAGNSGLFEHILAVEAGERWAVGPKDLGPGLARAGPLPSRPSPSWLRVAAGLGTVVRGTGHVTQS